MALEKEQTKWYTLPSPFPHCLHSLNSLLRTVSPVLLLILLDKNLEVPSVFSMVKE